MKFSRCTGVEDKSLAGTGHLDGLPFKEMRLILEQMQYLDPNKKGKRKGICKLLPLIKLDDVKDLMRKNGIPLIDDEPTEVAAPPPKPVYVHVPEIEWGTDPNIIVVPKYTPPSVGLPATALKYAGNTVKGARMLGDSIGDSSSDSIHVAKGSPFNPHEPLVEYEVENVKVQLPPFANDLLYTSDDIIPNWDVGTPDKDYEYQPSSFAHVSCGFSLDGYYRVRNVLCTALGGNSLKDFVDARACNPVSRLVATNIVRVSSQRIFADPMRSLMEPISNSIDSYRKLRGHPSIGKFGMGFFSILYWLMSDDSFISIESVHQLPDGRKCHWKSIIRRIDGEYQFTLFNSYVATGDIRTGTTIVVYSPGNIPTGVHDAIANTFYSVRDVGIRRFTVIQSSIEEADPMLVSETASSYTFSPKGLRHKDQVMVAFTSSYVMYRDYASGIDIDVYVTTMLIPTISNKIPPPPSVGYRYPSCIRRRPLDRDYLSITVGDIRVITIRDIPTIFSVSEYEDRMRSNDVEDAYTYVLSLPSNTPMPISRDDVILDSPVFLEIAIRECINLMEQAVRVANAEVFYRLLYVYSLESNTPGAFQLVNSIREYVNQSSSIYMIPRGYRDTYDSMLAAPEMKGLDISLIESDTPQYTKMRKLILAKFATYDSFIVNHKVIPIEIKKGKRVSNAGLTDILFVDRSLTTAYQIIQAAKPMILSTEMIAGDKLFQERKDHVYRILDKSLFSAEKISLLYNLMTIVKKQERLSDELGVILLGYVDLYLFELSKLTTNPEYIEEFMNLLYTSIIRMLNRPVPFGGNGTAIYAIDTPFTSRDVSYSTFTNPEEGPESYDNERLVIRNPRVLEYFFAFTSIYLNASASDDAAYAVIRDPLYNNAIRYLPNVHIQFINDFLEFIIDKPPVHYYYYSRLIFEYWRDINGNKVRLMDIIQFAYYELRNKYDVSTLTEAVKAVAIATISEASDGVDTIVKGLMSSIDIYLQMISGTVDKMNFGNIPYTKEVSTEFYGSQLVNFLFQNNVDMSTTAWLGAVRKSSKVMSTFKVYDVAINTGTSKAFASAIVTEMLQNSKDAILSYKNADRIKASTITLHVGEDQTGKMCIGVQDPVGIPLRGIVSALIPFLSTKAEVASATGEMGTGFMNLFRYPYSSEVVISTVDPDTGVRYRITVRPVVEDDRVVDLHILFSAVNRTDVNSGTLILVRLREELEAAGLSSVMAEASVFGKTTMPIMSLCNGFHTQINSASLRVPSAYIILDNEIATVYLTKDESDFRQSLLLTSGVPFSSLETVKNGLWAERTIGWIDYIYKFGIFINLHKGAYIPVQSRKHIIMSEREKNVLRALITYACVARIMIRTANKKGDNFYTPGLTYSGSADQCLPSSEAPDIENFFRSGRNAFESVLRNIGISQSVGFIVNEVYDQIPDKSVKPNRKLIAGILSKMATLKTYPKEIQDWVALTIIRWFTNKSGKEENKDVVIMGIGAGESVQVTKKSKVQFNAKNAKYIMTLIVSLTEHVWKWHLAHVTGFVPPVKKTPPKIVYVDEIGGNTAGEYHRDKHEIWITLKDLHLESYDASAKKFFRLWKVNIEQAVKFFEDDAKLSLMFGNYTSPTTIIHEMGHAMESSVHSGSAHKDMKFSIDGKPYVKPYFAACNVLWFSAWGTYEPKKSILNMIR